MFSYLFNPSDFMDMDSFPAGADNCLSGLSGLLVAPTVDYLQAQQDLLEADIECTLLLTESSPLPYLEMIASAVGEQLG